MSLTIATWLVRALEFYLLAGVIFAVFFALIFGQRGVGRVDPAAAEGTWGFRLLIVPGSVALWPLLLWRWLQGVTSPPAETNPHRTAASHRAAKSGADA